MHRRYSDISLDNTKMIMDRRLEQGIGLGDMIMITDQKNRHVEIIGQYENDHRSKAGTGEIIGQYEDDHRSKAGTGESTGRYYNG